MRSPALVLGSTQDDALVNRSAAERAGVEVCRRRSGGGLVGLEPGNDLWIDVIVPRGSLLWDDDVGRAFGFLGEVWADALASTLTSTFDKAVDRPTVEVHRGQPIRRDAGRIVCFAGLGWGEVTVDGHKVVGLSQRRTRHAARFQSVMTWRWNPSFLEPLIRSDQMLGAGIRLTDLEIGLPRSVLDSPRTPTIATMTDAFLHTLPSASEIPRGG